MRGELDNMGDLSSYPRTIDCRRRSGQHYSLTGEWLDVDINRRVVGISLDTLAKIDTVMGVAGGSRKGAAILGALRGGYVNVLATDDQAARRVLVLREISSR
jgi:DNA-binding transcriptional regulator LsrR (DeoR family)